MRVTGQHLLLLLWTLWLVIALLSIGGWLGVILLLVFGPLGLGLILTGVVSWRTYLIAALTVHVLAAAVAVFVQLRPEHPVSAWMRRSPLLASVQRWPMQVLPGSVSLAGLIWLLILRPAVHWMYRADIPIMIATVAVLVAAEYGCWVLLKNVDRRNARLSQRLDALEQTQTEFRQTQEELRELQDEHRDAQGAFRHEQEELRRVQDELRRVQDELRRAQGAFRHEQDELRHAQAQLRHAQAQLHEAQDELRQAQGELRQELDELRPAQEASKPPHSNHSDPPVWYHSPADVRSWAESDQVADAGAIRVELIRIARLSPGPGSSVSQPDRPAGIMMERRTVTFSPAPGETVGEVTRRAEEHLGREIETAATEYAAQTIGDPVWKTVSERWVADGSAGFDTAARTVADFDADVHNILLNKPVQQLSYWAGLPGPVSAVLGGVAGAAEIPIDRPLHAVTRIIQVGGIVVGTMSGNPVLVSACFKSLVHDEFIRGVAKGIEEALRGCGVSNPSQRAATERPAAEHAAAEQAAAQRALAEQAAEARAAAERERAARLGRDLDEPGNGPSFSPFG